MKVLIVEDDSHIRAGLEEILPQLLSAGSILKVVADRQEVSFLCPPDKAVKLAG